MLSKKLNKILAVTAALSLMIGTLTACNSTDTNGASGEVNFPDKTVSLLVWGSPGGGSDVFGRTLARAAETPLGTPVVVENKPGGGGATAMAYLSGQNPNGYNLLAVTTNLVLTPLTKDTPNTYADFDPIIMIGRDATMTVAKTGGEIQSIEDIVKIGKERNIKWGTFGVGTSDHVSAAIFQKQTGIKVDFIPYDGGGEAMTALLGGHIDLLNGNPSEVSGQLEAETLKAIGVYSEARLEDYSDVPTFSENGYDILVETWRGIVSSKGVDEKVKQILFEGFEEALNDPAMEDYFKKNNIIKDVKKGEEFFNFIEAQNQFYTETLTEMGIIK